MTNDKANNQSQSSIPVSRKNLSSLKRGKSIIKKVNLNQQKRISLKLCPMTQTRKMTNCCPFKTTHTDIKNIVSSEYESTPSIEVQPLYYSESDYGLSQSQDADCTSLSQKLLKSHSTLEQDIKEENKQRVQEEFQKINEQNSLSNEYFSSQNKGNSLSMNNIKSMSGCNKKCMQALSNYSCASSSREEIYIRNHINHEPILFLHNKWDILPNKDYNIFGDILIETDFVSDKKFSSQNHWKPPLNIEILPKKCIVRMNIGSYGTTMLDFSIISNFMKMCNLDEIQSYAQNLDRWQITCNRLLFQKREQLESEEDELKYTERMLRFEIHCDQLIEQLNNQGKIFFYSKKRFNVYTHNLEEYECGFNQYLLAILGCEIEDLPSIVMRQGRPNLFDTKSRLKISQQLVLNYLNINLSTQQQIEITPQFTQHVNLITMDDLQVPCVANSYCTNFNSLCKLEDESEQSGESLLNTLPNGIKSKDIDTSQIVSNFDYDFVLQIVELEIEAEHISTLLNIREVNDYEQKIQELKENIQYEFDIHILIQKYYQQHPAADPSRII